MVRHACHFCMIVYQLHWKHRAAIRRKPAKQASTKAMRNDVWGEKPAAAMERKKPSRLHATEKLPHFMPFKLFFATSSAFINAPEETAILLVICGLLLISTIIIWGEIFENIELFSLFTIYRYLNLRIASLWRIALHLLYNCTARSKHVWKS